MSVRTVERSISRQLHFRLDGCVRQRGHDVLSLAVLAFAICDMKDRESVTRLASSCALLDSQLALRSEGCQES